MGELVASWPRHAREQYCQNYVDWRAINHSPKELTTENEVSKWSWLSCAGEPDKWYQRSAEGRSQIGYTDAQLFSAWGQMGYSCCQNPQAAWLALKGKSYRNWGKKPEMSSYGVVL